MRVAHIITRLIVGGAQENTVLNCQDLQRDWGDEVVLITGPSDGPEGDLELDAKGRGVRLIRVPTLGRSIHPWRDLQAFRHLRQILREFRPEVVHTHSAKGGMLGREAAWSLQVPAVVHTVHGAPFHPYQSRAARWFFERCERHAALRCHALISVANAMTDLLVAAGVAPRDQFTTIYSGMETAPFLAVSREVSAAARARWQLSPEDVVVGKIARLFHLKGHSYLVEAARGAIQQVPQLKFLLVGDGILRAELEQQIAAAGLQHAFRFTGLLRPQEIPEALSAIDFVVHTSLREGLARILPQALLAARPAISFDIDGAREVIEEGVTGRLISPRDIAGLTQAMVQMANSAEQRLRWGEAGRQRCQTRFCHHQMTDQIRTLYQRCLNG